MRKADRDASRYWPCRFSKRRGSLLVEAVLAAGILATCMLAVTRLGRSYATLQQHQNARLTTALAADNFLHRMQTVGLDSAQQQAQQHEQSIEQASGVSLQTQVIRLQSPLEGWHVQVTASSSGGVSVTRDGWILAREQDETEVVQ